MRRLIVIAIFCLVTSCIVFLFSPLTTSSNAQDDSDRATNFPVVEQATGKKMPVDKVGIRRLKENTRESAVVSINEATGAAAFVRLANNKSVDLSVFKDSADARGKSDDFFRQYGSLFGIKNPAAELRYENETGEDNGAKHQTYQQFYNGVPVFAGTLKTHLDKEIRLYAVNGTFVPEIEIDVNPVFMQTEAAAVAVAKVSEEKSADGLFAAKIELYVYRTGLIKGVPGNDFLTWQIEVTNNTDIREFVFIDAQTNKTVDQFTGIHDALSRRAYDGLSLPNVPPSYPAAPFWTEGQAFPTVSTEANNMLIASKETYDVFKNAFNRDSFNGSGATMDSIFNRGYSCPNASWNGTFISFCAGLTTDDVTAHEWGHAYTEFTHGLIYQWQPGALNESYSDIYGEIIDRINNRDNVGNSASDAARSPGICSGSTRWLLGEDATGGISGALRDMYNPNCFNDPGKVSDAVYVCGSGDSGGVHSNSGVPNHAFALLVDGGTYNGQTINAFGLTKAAHIYFRAMNIYQQRDSDFADHADALEQSANDLRIAGTNLADLQTGLPSGQTITAADVSEVQKAILAVQMRTPPTQCNFVPLLAKNPPAEAVCGIGTARRTIFANDFEGGASGWTIGKQETTGTFSLPDWLVTTGLPDDIPGKAFYASDPNVGSCSAAGSQKGVRFLKSPTIQIPTGTVTNPTFSFDHWIALESGYDGAQLLISVNGGAFTLVPQANFLYNAHNTTLVTAGGGNDNPRASQRAWTGADGGAVSGSWGKTMVNLTGLVSPGNTVQFRWDLSTDGCGGT
ncbi:MAG: M4 family metallopeptidase, partial [Acidobacteriota bacterium]|nr:M4 family metallopeptidase [Acidobacteriota bacterium]